MGTMKYNIEMRVLEKRIALRYLLMENLKFTIP